MNLGPFLSANPAIQVHVAITLAAVLLAPGQLFILKRGSRAHRAVGYLWLGLMILAALSSFLIPSHFWFSYRGYGLIHLVSALSLIAAAYAVRQARRGAIRAHRTAMLGLTTGLFAAGFISLIPPRLMAGMMFGG